MIRYALMAVPGPGDAFLRRAAEREKPPAVIIRQYREDFPEAPCRCETIDDLDAWDPAAEGIDALLVTGWEKRIAGRFRERFRLGGWNVHPSLLPDYRGHNPYFHVIREGREETGVTVHALTDEIDAGPILLQRSCPVRADETIGTLWAKLNELGAEAGLEALALLEGNLPALRPQPASAEGCPRAPRVRSEDLVLGPGLTRVQALRLVRAANPFFGATAPCVGTMVKVYEARAEGEPGASGPCIACSDGRIVATVLDVPGRGFVSGAVLEEGFGA